jgi:hypothetical protein
MLRRESQNEKRICKMHQTSQRSDPDITGNDAGAKKSKPDARDTFNQSRRLDPVKKHWRPASPSTAIFAALLKAFRRKGG